MRRLISALVLALAAAACSAGGADEPSSTTAPSTTTTRAPTPTTTTSSTTTTTTLPPLDTLPNSGLLQPEITYTGTLDIVGQGFELAFELDDWRVLRRGGTGRFVRFENRSASPGADILLMAWQFDSDPDSVLASVLEHRNMAEATPVEETTVAQLSARVADFRALTGIDERCLQQIPVVADTRPGGIGTSLTEWIHGCTWGRMLALEVNGVTISIVATANALSRDPDTPPLIEDFEPLLDDFINGITFCTETTPCDD